jgi:hypothetical protein
MGSVLRRVFSQTAYGPDFVISATGDSTNLRPTLKTVRNFGGGRRRFHRHNLVVDRWWPWRYGTVIKARPVLLIKWDDGEVWRYDRAHQVFLSKVKRPYGSHR